ncbi:MAG: transcription antitermination factor NusB [Kistimonas sp.]|nr:transcription antitermination factor NusB [Kistimonas sp.]
MQKESAANTGKTDRKALQRRRARELTLQALYQWEMAGASVSSIEAEFRDRNDMTRIDGEFFHDLLTGVARQVGVLDKTLVPLLDREFDRLDPVERAALRLGCFEMMERLEVPYRVVINEGIELARRYGAQGSYKYINNILDQLARRLRSQESGRGPAARRVPDPVTS